MKKLLALVCALTFTLSVGAQIFDMKKTYTGFHYAFSRFNTDGINRFVVAFNQMYQNDIAKGFHQYKGNELGQTFTTSGFRLIWGKKDIKWTFTSDYAFGWGRDKNKAEFKNGIVQHMDIHMYNNQINSSFGVAMKDNKVWAEILYCTSLGKAVIEYSTEYPNGVSSYGTEYKLNGVYTGNIKTMQFGVQLSHKYKKYVFYGRALLPVAIIGPDKSERTFTDPRNSQYAPQDFPSDYNNYVNNPTAYVSQNGALNSSNFKGFSYGFGMFYLIGKDK